MLFSRSCVHFTHRTFHVIEFICKKSSTIDNFTLSVSQSRNMDSRKEYDAPLIDHESLIRRQSVLRSRSLDITHLLSEVSDAEKNMLLKEAPFYKIVFTGGPCGGKTTALARVSYFLRERGFEVFTVPEAFTLISNNGFSLNYFEVVGMGLCFQSNLMDLQMALEDSFERVLRARGKPSVLLCDRGLMDGSAYMDMDEWEKLLLSKGFEAADIREGRYNAVMHMVTAAEGAERYYTLENNEVRTESPEQAREVDRRSRLAWVGHPKLFVFDNSTDFEGKLQRLVDTIANLVGLPSKLSKASRKYLLRKSPRIEDFPDDLKYNIFEVEKVYLHESSIDTYNKDGDESDKQIELGCPDNEYTFIRKRSNISPNGHVLGSSYGFTNMKIVDGQHIEVKRIISAREYNSAFKTRDRNRHIVRQTRICFLWRMQSFTVHIYKEPIFGLCILQAQSESDMNEDIPPFLEVERALSNCDEDTKKYGAFNISLISK